MWQVSLSLTLCFIISLTSIVSNEAARILVAIPTPSKSHQKFFRPLAQELAKRGHEVFVITTDPGFNKDEAPANLQEIDVHDISYKAWREYFYKLPRGRKSDLYTQVEVALKLYTFIFEQQIQSVDIQNIIHDKNKKFDVLLLEACVRPSLIYSHLYEKAPVIQINSLDSILDNTVGAPSHPILYPSSIRQNLYNLSILEEVTETYNQFKIEQLYYSLEEQDNGLFKRNFGSDSPTVDKLKHRINMLFLNDYLVYGGNRPMPPAVISIAGIHQKPDEELPQDLKSYLDSSVKGVIYMSFGTNTIPSMLPPEIIQIFVKVFSELPYDILWKWDKDELLGKSENIKISKWLPQQNLLEHPNIKLFITQGGMHSIDEAIIAGVPMIGIPMSGDQWFNVEKMVKHGLGTKLGLETLSLENLRHSIDKVISDESYRHNVLKLGKLLLDQPQTALERAVWWTEYVLRHGTTDHLKASAAFVTWTEYFELELLFSILFTLLILIVAAAFVGYCLIKSLHNYVYHVV